jgi:hypothetical protein
VPAAFSEADADAAITADQQGIGAGADLVRRG